MRVRAKTDFGNAVEIIGFVTKYDAVYAVTIRQDGSLWEYPIDELTVIDSY